MTEAAERLFRAWDLMLAGRRRGPVLGDVLNVGFEATSGLKLGNELVAKIKKAAHDVKIKAFGPNEKDWPKLKPDRVALRDGDLEDWDGYEGHFYLAANSARKPQIITNRKDKDGWIPAQEGAPGAPYSGCFVNALVRLWVQNNEHGKRLNASLEIVQFLRDGEAFGAAPVDPNEKFGDDMVGDEGGIGDDDDSDDDLI